MRSSASLPARLMLLQLSILAMLAWPSTAMSQAAAPRAPVQGEDAARLRQAMIAASIAAYPGNCPCPYSTMRNGRRCGSRSAYSKPGGAAPLCYPGDISDATLAQARASR